eukprot:scaffold414399_cov18-Prasinocladus_malaysianus.AAC.1
MSNEVGCEQLPYCKKSPVVPRYVATSVYLIGSVVLRASNVAHDPSVHPQGRASLHRCRASEVALIVTGVWHAEQLLTRPRGPGGIPSPSSIWHVITSAPHVIVHSSSIMPCRALLIHGH